LGDAGGERVANVNQAVRGEKYGVDFQFLGAFRSYEILKNDVKADSETSYNPAIKAVD
jgi:hypothetical protein